VLHFNNAGAALPADCVLDTVLNHLRLEASIGGYEAAARAALAIERTYTAVARLLNAQPDEIALVESATRAWDMAFYAIPFARGDRILTARAEYASNVIALLQVAARTGAEVEVIPDDESGQLSVEALREAIDDRVKLIAMTHVPTDSGLGNPAVEVGQVARQAGALYLLDACQSAGQMPLDVQAIGCDMLSATGRKFLRGPRGTGFLYIRRSLVEQLEPPLLDLHAATLTGPDTYVVRPDARRFEAWENNFAGQIGLGVAVDYALDWGLEAIRQRVFGLAAQLRGGLAGLAGVTVHDRGREQCGIVTFSVEGRSAEDITAALAAQGMNVWVVSRLVRASVHYYNTRAEVERFCEQVWRLSAR